MIVLRKIMILSENGKEEKKRIDINKKFNTQEEAEKFFRQFRDSYPQKKNERVVFYPHYREI